MKLKKNNFFKKIENTAIMWFTIIVGIYPK